MAVVRGWWTTHWASGVGVGRVGCGCSRYIATVARALGVRAMVTMPMLAATLSPHLMINTSSTDSPIPD